MYCLASGTCACAVLKANNKSGPTKTGPAGPLATAMTVAIVTPRKATVGHIPWNISAEQYVTCF